MAWLLDTHALIWALFEPEKLGDRTRTVLEDPHDEVLVSPLTYWEISLKSGLGKLELPDTDPREIPAAALQLGLAEAPLSSEMLATYHHLPRNPDHRDPFDRLLIWQCITAGHTLLSRDPALPFYKSRGLAFDW